MIEFKIITAADRSQQASYSHNGRELTFGRTEGDMIIDDPQFAARQFLLRYEGNSFVVENLDPKQLEVRLNGKAITGAYPIRERDNVSAGKTTINFSRLDANPPATPEPYTNPQAHTRFAEGTKERAIQDALDILIAGGGTARAAPPPLPPGMPPPPLPGASKPPLPPPPPRKV